MKPKSSIAAIITVLAILLLGSCKESRVVAFDAWAMSIFASGGSVYVAGYCLDSEEVPTACYWKDAARVDMPDYASVAYSSFVSGDTVYTAGERWYEPSGWWIPCYWTGTTRTDITTEKGYANSIYVSGGDIYTTGVLIDSSDTRVPYYWNGLPPMITATQLPAAGGTNSAYAYSIFVDGTTVYTAGRYYNGVGWIACYWTGATRTDLPGGSGAAYSIFVDVNTDTVYTAGEYFDGTNWHACYWVNTGRNELPDTGGDNPYATSIFYDGTDVYTAGAYSESENETPLYWINTASYTLLPCVGSGYATSIFVSGGTVYTSGNYSSGSVSIPCFWTNTTRRDLPANTSIVKAGLPASKSALPQKCGRPYPERSGAP